MQSGRPQEIKSGVGQIKGMIHHKSTTNTERGSAVAQSNPAVAMEKSSEINVDYPRKRNTNPQELLDIESSPLKKPKSDEITTNRSIVTTMPADADDNLSENALSADGINLASNQSDNNGNDNKSSPAAPVPKDASLNHASLNRPGSADNESNNMVRKARVSVRARCEAPMVIIN